MTTTLKTARILSVLMIPMLFAACTTRQLDDGSYTFCKVGHPCQQARTADSVEPTFAKKHHKKKHKKVKKEVKAAAESKETGKPVTKTEETKK